MNESQIIAAIKAHIAKGDKAAEKSEQHYIAAGQHLHTLKAEHGGTWAEWEKLLKTKVGIGKSRASELMAIADGTKTLEEVRAVTARRTAKTKARLLSASSGENVAMAYTAFDKEGRPVWNYKGHEHPRNCNHPTAHIMSLCPVCGGTQLPMTEAEADEFFALSGKAFASYRELAQWIMDNHSHYSDAQIAEWVGREEAYIKVLRRWAENGFKGPLPDDA